MVFWNATANTRVAMPMPSAMTVRIPRAGRANASPAPRLSGRGAQKGAAGERPDRDADDRAGHRRQDHLPDENRDHLCGRESERFHDSDVAIAGQDSAGHNAPDDYGYGRESKQRKRKDHARH